MNLPTYIFSWNEVQFKEDNTLTGAVLRLNQICEHFGNLALVYTIYIEISEDEPLWIITQKHC